MKHNASSKELVIAALIAVAGCQTSIQQKTEPFPWREGNFQHLLKVSSDADSGPGTLREAIKLANNSPGLDRIIFESEGQLFSKPVTIWLESDLPAISDDVLIDGFIDDMLWKASGVSVDGQQKYRGFYVTHGVSAKIKHLTLENTRSTKGGGLYSDGYLVVEGVSFINNHAGRGGAIYAEGPKTHIYNSLFFNNSAKGNGGALYLAEGDSRLTNNTITANLGKKGAGLFNDGKLQINNSIISGNFGLEDCYSVSTPSIANRNIIPSGHHCGEAFSKEPVQFSNPGYYNGPIKSLSPPTDSAAFNWGSNELAVDEFDQPLVWDQRGNGDPRYASGITDIGAFEIQPKILIEVDTASTTEIRGCTPRAYDCSLSGAISLVDASPRYQRVTFSQTICGEKLLLPTLNSDLAEALILDASMCQHSVTIIPPQSTLPAKLTLKNILLVE